VEGKRSGQGVYAWPNVCFSLLPQHGRRLQQRGEQGSTYVGEWKDGHQEGWGIYRWPSGSLYMVPAASSLPSFFVIASLRLPLNLTCRVAGEGAIKTDGASRAGVILLRMKGSGSRAKSTAKALTPGLVCHTRKTLVCPSCGIPSRMGVCPTLPLPPSTDGRSYKGNWQAGKKNGTGRYLWVSPSLVLSLEAVHLFGLGSSHRAMAPLTMASGKLVCAMDMASCGAVPARLGRSSF